MEPAHLERLQMDVQRGGLVSSVIASEFHVCTDNLGSRQRPGEIGKASLN